jgi:hypothetical protein
MPIEYFGFGDLSDGLKEIGLKLTEVDMDRVEKESLERMTDAMRNNVRQAVFESGEIQSPARKISKYEAGPGPAMATKDAYRVIQDGNRFVLTPRPLVRTRAVVLNEGYPGMIRPNGPSPMRFTINGFPTYRYAVRGPVKSAFWENAFQKLQNDGRIPRIMKEELEEEFDESGF